MLRFKLDENFSPALAENFKKSGHETETVLDENLSGSPDEAIFQVCLAENRCLVTFDLDFSNIMRFPVENTPGIIVVRPNRQVTLAVMAAVTQQILLLLETNDPTGCLWIVEPTQLRVRKPHS